MFVSDGGSMEEVKEELNRYILDFLQKSSFSKTAATFARESNTRKRTREDAEEEEEVVDTPQGFLYEWWLVFWDIFNSTTNRGGSDSAQAYFKMVLQQQRQEHIYRSLAIHAARLQHIAEQRGEYKHEEVDPMMFGMMLSRINPTMNNMSNIFPQPASVPGNTPSSVPGPSMQMQRPGLDKKVAQPQTMKKTRKQQADAATPSSTTTTTTTNANANINSQDNSYTTYGSPVNTMGPGASSFMFSPQQINDVRQPNEIPYTNRPTPGSTTDMANLNMSSGFSMPMMSPQMLQQAMNSNGGNIPNWFMFGMPNNPQQLMNIYTNYNNNDQASNFTNNNNDNNNNINNNNNNNNYGNTPIDDPSNFNFNTTTATTTTANTRQEKKNTKERKSAPSNIPKNIKKGKNLSPQETQDNKTTYSSGSPETTYDDRSVNNNDSPHSVRNGGVYSPSLSNTNEMYSNPGSVRSPMSTGGETPSSVRNNRTANKGTKSKARTPSTQSNTTQRKKRATTSQTVTTPKTMIVTPVLTSSVNQNATPSSVSHYDDFDAPLSASGGNSKKNTTSPRDYPSSGSNQDVETVGSAATPIDTYPATQRAKKTAKSSSTGISPKTTNSPAKNNSGVGSPKRTSSGKKNVRRKSTPILHEQSNAEQAFIRKSTPANIPASQDDGSNATTPNVIFNNMSMVNFTNKPALSSPLSTVPESFFEHEGPQESKKTPSSYAKSTRTDKNKDQSSKSDNTTPASSSNFNDQVDNNDHTSGSHINSVNSVNSVQSNDSHHSRHSHISQANENLSETKSSKSKSKPTPDHNSIIDDPLSADAQNKINFDSGLPSTLHEEAGPHNDGTDMYNFYDTNKSHEDLLFIDSMFDDAIITTESTSHDNDSKITDLNDSSANNANASTEPNILLNSNDHGFFMD